MEKLELKHLAPYLPYGLKVIIPYHQEKGIMNLIKLSKYQCWLDNGGSIHLWQEQYIDKIKPILRPLSDLTKEELINAGFDYQIDWLTHEREYHVKRYKSLEKFINKTDFGHVQYLISQHYDIFGLIEQGLAIDINTLNQEL